MCSGTDSKTENMVTIRPAIKSDCTEIAKLIKGLEEYHNMSEGSTITVKELEENGFGNTAYFECIVAEESTPTNTHLVGELLYFYTFSTVYGRSVHVEDFYISPEVRKQGIGTQLLKAVTKIALARGCRKVRNSNQPAINFYKRQGAKETCFQEKDGWLSYMMDKDTMDNLLSSI